MHIPSLSIDLGDSYKTKPYHKDFIVKQGKNTEKLNFDCDLIAMTPLVFLLMEIVFGFLP